MGNMSTIRYWTQRVGKRDSQAGRKGRFPITWGLKKTQMENKSIY